VLANESVALSAVTDITTFVLVLPARLLKL